MIATARRTPALCRAGHLAGRPHALAALAVALFLVAALPAAAAPVLVDSFTTNQATITDPPGGSSTATTAGADIIGLRRGLTVDVSSGVGPVSVGVAAGVLSFAVTATTPDSRGTATATWDGDLTPLVLSPTGLGGVDLTGGGTNSGLAIELTAVTGTVELVVTIYTDGSNASRAGARVSAAGTRVLPFSQLAVLAGTGADLTDVGAIVLEILGTESSASITQIQAVTPAVAATKVDLDTSNVALGSTTVVPGDTIRYRITITNPGGEATAVDISDVIDTNVELPGGEDVLATPVAQPRQFIGFGNVTLDVSVAAGGLLAGARDPDMGGSNPTLQLAGSQTTSAQGGTINYGGMTDGTFDYVPPAGFRGVDSFNFTVIDDDGQTTLQTATIVLGERVWFVDDSAAPGGNGTQALPFDAIADVNSVSDPDEANEIIFIRSGSYDVAAAGGFALEAGQRILGEGVGLILNGQTIVPAGAAPTITNTLGSGLVLAMDNTLRGFTVGNTTGGDVTGSNFGTLTVSDVTLNGTGGALDLDNGALAATFTGVTSTSSATAIDLDAVTGTLTTGGTTISGATTRGIRVINGGSTYSFGATSVNAADGILLTTNATSTFNFTSLAVTSTAGAGLTATTSGTLNIGGTGNTINATGGAALDVTSTSLGTGATFSTVSSSGSAGKGINLDTVSGPLTMNGGSITTAAGIDFDVSAGSGAISYAGSISNAASRAVEITGRTTSTVTVSGNISDSGTGINIGSNSGGTINLSGTYNGTATTAQIDVTGNSGTAVVNFSGSSKVLSTAGNNAIDVTSNGTAQVNFTGGGLSVTTTSGVGFNAVTGTGGVTVQGTGNTITSTTGTALNVSNATIGALDMTFERISSGVAAGSGPANGINLNNTGTLGGLVVTGAGGTCTFATPTCTGGTIQSSSSDAVKLVSTQDVSLTRMRIHDNDTNGIYGDELTNFTLANSVVSDNDVANPSAFEAGVKFNELYGTNSISDTVVRGTKGDNIRLEMASGILTSLTLTSVTVGPTANVGGGFSNGFSIVTSGTPTLTVTVTGSLFTGLDSTKQQSSGILTSIGGGTTTLSIINSDFEHENIGIDLGSSSTGVHKFNVDDNDVTFHRTNAINIVGSSVLDGTINNNRVGNGTADSGSMNSFGIAASHRGNSNWFLAITNNVVKNSDFEGIFVRTGDLLAGDSGTVNLTLTDNTVFTPDDNSGFPANPKGMHLRSRQATTLCMNVEDNEAQGNGAAGYHLQESDTSQLRFQGFTTNAVTTLTAKNNKTAGGAPTTNEVGAPFAGACTPTLPSFP